MKQIYTNAEVGKMLGIPTRTVTEVARHVLFVPRIGYEYNWTRKYIRRFEKILVIGRGKRVEL